MEGADRNPVSVLNEYCQKIKGTLVFTEIPEDAGNEEGRFGYSVSVRTAEGTQLQECSARAAKKKNAQRLAAQAWLQHHFPTLASSDATRPVMDTSAIKNVEKGAPDSGQADQKAEKGAPDSGQAGQRKSRKLIEIQCDEHEKLDKLQLLMLDHAPGKNFSSVVFSPPEHADSILRMLREDPTLIRLGIHVDRVDCQDIKTPSFRGSVEALWRGTTSILVACPFLGGDLIPPDCRLIVQFAPEGENGVKFGKGEVRRFKAREVEVTSFCGGAFMASHALQTVFLPRPAVSPPEQTDTHAPSPPAPPASEPPECSQRGERKPSRTDDVAVTGEADGAKTEQGRDEQTPQHASPSGKQNPAVEGGLMKEPYAVPSALRIADVSAQPVQDGDQLTLHVHALSFAAENCDCESTEDRAASGRLFCVVAGQELEGVAGMTLHPPFPHRCQHARRVRLQYHGAEQCDAAQIEQGVRYFGHTEAAVAELCAREEEDAGKEAEDGERAALPDWDGMAIALPFREGVGVDWGAVREVNAWFDEMASRKRKKPRREAAAEVFGACEAMAGGALLWARSVNSSAKLSDWRACVYARRLEETVGAVRMKRFGSREEWEAYYAELKARAEKEGAEVPEEEALPVHERYWESFIAMLKGRGLEEAEAWREVRMLGAWPLPPGQRAKNHTPAMPTDQPIRLVPVPALCHLVPLPALALCLPAIVATLHRLALPLELSRALLGPSAPPPRLLLSACTTPQSTAIVGACAPYCLRPEGRAAAAAAEEEEEWVDDDYQRLEFLGDALVHVAASLCVAAQSPAAGQQVLVRKVSYRVSNRELERLACRATLRLPRFILNQKAPFLPGREPGLRLDASLEREVAAKNCADVLEAVVGACWLQDAPASLLPGCAWQALLAFGLVTDRDHASLPQQIRALRQSASSAEHAAAAWSALDGDAPGGLRAGPCASEEEQQRCLGHVFGAPGLLAAATLHPSAEAEEEAGGALCSVLFCLGDAALKAVLARLLFRKLPRAAPQHLTDARACLWSAEALCRAAVGQGWHGWLRCASREQQARWQAEVGRYAAAIEKAGPGGAVGGGTDVDESGVGVEEPRALNRAVRKVFGALLLDSVLEHGLARVEGACDKLLGPLMAQRVLLPRATQTSAAATPSTAAWCAARGGWVNSCLRLEELYFNRVEYEWLGCVAGIHEVQVWVDGRKAGEVVRGDSFFAGKMLAAAVALRNLGV